MANNVDEIARQMAATQMLPVDRNAQNDNSNDKDKSQFEQMLAMLAMSNRMNPQTMGGFLVGQILGGGLNSWANDYKRRGRVNDEILGASGDEREKLLEELRQSNPSHYQRWMKRLGRTPNSAPPMQQPDTTGINTARTNQLAQGLLGGENPLTNAADQQFEDMPAVNAPFQNSWDNAKNWKKYNLLNALQRR